MPAPLAGTEGYAEAAAGLLARRLDFARVHAPLLHLLPAAPARVLDVGAGPGHDAAALAAAGYAVTAVEPVAELRDGGRALYPRSAIEWIDDRLPDLAALAGREGGYDLVLLSVVWMHLDAARRRRGLPRLAALLRPGGRLFLSLRHGPVPAGRRMFRVSGAETIALAEATGLETLLRRRRGSVQEANRRAGVTWTHLAFARSGCSATSPLAVVLSDSEGWRRCARPCGRTSHGPEARGRPGYSPVRKPRPGRCVGGLA